MKFFMKGLVLMTLSLSVFCTEVEIQPGEKYSYNDLVVSCINKKTPNNKLIFVDNLTNKTWYYVGHLNITSISKAQELCQEIGYDFPTRNEVLLAMSRLVNSSVGKQAYKEETEYQYLIDASTSVTHEMELVNPRNGKISSYLGSNWNPGTLWCVK